MLEVGDATTLNEDQWKVLAAQTLLAKGVADYFATQRAGKPRKVSRRRFNRQPLRSIAMLLFEDQRLAAFTKDLSRTGIGFFSPVHLFPKRLVQLWLPQGRIFRLRVTRCVRRADDCFDCGTVFQRDDEKA